MADDATLTRVEAGELRHRVIPNGRGRGEGPLGNDGCPGGLGWAKVSCHRTVEVGIEPIQRSEGTYCVLLGVQCRLSGPAEPQHDVLEGSPAEF